MLKPMIPHNYSLDISSIVVLACHSFIHLILRLLTILLQIFKIKIFFVHLQLFLYITIKTCFDDFLKFLKKKKII